MTARLGEWDVALAAGEGRRLADELGQVQWAAAAETTIALVAAMRGG